MDDGGGVEEQRPDRHGQPEHVDGGQVGRVGGERLEGPPLRVEERPPLHEVLGRVAAEHLLGKGAERDLVGGHLAGGADDRARGSSARRRRWG